MAPFQECVFLVFYSFGISFHALIFSKVKLM